VVFQGKVFVPTRVMPRGRYKERYAVVTIDCNQVNEEELVNDPQFLADTPLPLPTDNDAFGYGAGGYGY
jgi:hypothetical protein